MLGEKQQKPLKCALYHKLKTKQEIIFAIRIVMPNSLKRIRKIKTLSEEGVLSWWWTLGCREGFPFTALCKKHPQHKNLMGTILLS